MQNNIKPRKEREDQPFVLVQRHELLPLNITDVEEEEIRNKEGVKALEEKENNLYDELYKKSLQYKFARQDYIKEALKKECDRLWEELAVNGHIHREYKKLACLPDDLFGTMVLTPLQRRRWSNYSFVKYANLGDNELRIESYVEEKIKDEEIVDYYSEDVLNKVGPAGQKFLEEQKNKSSDEEGFEFNVEKSYEEKIEDNVNKLDAQNRWLKDTQEINYLWDYWKIVKISQLIAGHEADSSECYKADLELIKQGVKPTACQDDEELIHLHDELQRVSDEVKKLRKEAGILVESVGLDNQQIVNIEQCKCGGGSTTHGYYKEGKLIKCCESCAKDNKVRFDYLCAGCNGGILGVRFGYLNKDGKLVCNKSEV